MKILFAGSPGSSAEILQDLFNQECAALTVCPYSQNHNKCIDLCLMPKLNFMEIRDNEVTIKLIIEKLKTHSTIYK